MNMGLDRFRAHKANPDFIYIALVAILVLFGLVMISSASVVLSVELYNENYAFVLKQATALGIGLVGAAIVSRVPFMQWQKWAPVFLFMSLMLVLLVFIPGLGKTANGASRWIAIGGFQLQPSELLKLSFIFYLAAWIKKRGNRIRDFYEGFLPFGMLVVPLIVLLMLQRDMGTLLVLLAIATSMFFMSGASRSHMLIGAVVGVVMLGMLIAAAPYRMQRLTTFLNPGADKLGAGYHLNQALIAVGSGGLWGRGFGESLQKYLYLPEAHTDSIFAITVEELGFFRSLIVLAVIALLAYRGYQIAGRLSDVFGRMVVFGITTWFLFQALLNIGAILGVVPLTGVPLTFISYGGTSLIVNLLAVGVVVNASKYS